ncbi:hypothetical protein BOTCAL_0536g00020 [Botryotinia calthae]|uniref:Uncharacterized protein n=1 Tax=Botryotinia calthae TaxID=38488 RepID=A0A4Y8CL41_9HELO|nr:hypothetical protein BOTCAL_0536g00020 [Botryotinia calthae]
MLPLAPEDNTKKTKKNVPPFEIPQGKLRYSLLHIASLMRAITTPQKTRTRIAIATPSMRNETLKRNSGGEITIFHLGVLDTRETRQRRPARQEGAKKLEEMLKLDKLIGRDGIMGILSVPFLKLRYVNQQIRRHNELGPIENGLPRAFYDAAQI